MNISIDIRRIDMRYRPPSQLDDEPDHEYRQRYDEWLTRDQDMDLWLTRMVDADRQLQISIHSPTFRRDDQSAAINAIADTFRMIGYKLGSHWLRHNIRLLDGQD